MTRYKAGRSPRADEDRGEDRHAQLNQRELACLPFERSATERSGSERVGLERSGLERLEVEVLCEAPVHAVTGEVIKKTTRTNAPIGGSPLRPVARAGRAAPNTRSPAVSAHAATLLRLRTA